MSDDTKIILITLIATLALASILGLLMYFAGKEAKFVHDKLDEFERESKKQGVTEAELRKIHTELVAFANKNCGFRGYGSRAREISTYIKGRLDGLTK